MFFRAVLYLFHVLAVCLTHIFPHECLLRLVHIFFAYWVASGPFAGKETSVAIFRWHVPCMFIFPGLFFCIKKHIMGRYPSFHLSISIRNELTSWEIENPGKSSSPNLFSLFLPLRLICRAKKISDHPLRHKYPSYLLDKLNTASAFQLQLESR